MTEQLVGERLTPEEVISDYEKRLIGEPNNSLIWIKYMGTILKLTDVHRARQVAERALKTISFREETEKENVWVAYMNLELAFGGAQGHDNMRRIFDRAVIYCDSRKMHMHLAKIYISANRHQDAVQIYDVMVKKFAQSCKIWCAYAEYLYARDLGSARKLLSRALLALPKRKHEKVSFRFAQMEYRHGSTERGRTLFEEILANHPKRIDIWSIYLTMEENNLKDSSNQNVDYCRRLFERVVHLKLSSKKAKFFFKRYLDFEKKHGSPEGAAHVKDLVRSYVDRL